MKNILLILLTVTLSLNIASCKNEKQEQIENSLVKLLTYDSFVMDDSTKTTFENSSNLKVDISLLGDGNELAAKLKLTKDNPIGDIVYGIDDTNVNELKQEGVIRDVNLVAKGSVCINADKSYFESKKLDYPKSFEDLISPKYNGLLVIESPMDSTPGLVFLAGLKTILGDSYSAYLSKLLNNKVKVVSGWTEAYNKEFSKGGGSGKFPLVLSYSSSPAWTVNSKGTKTTTTSLDFSCVQDNEYSAILNNSKNIINAKKVLNFMQTDAYQKTIPETIYIYPKNKETKLPKIWMKFAQNPQNPIIIDNEFIRNKKQYLDEFQQILDNIQ